MTVRIMGVRLYYEWNRCALFMLTLTTNDQFHMYLYGHQTINCAENRTILFNFFAKNVLISAENRQMSQWVLILQMRLHNVFQYISIFHMIDGSLFIGFLVKCRILADVRIKCGRQQLNNDIMIKITTEIESSYVSL